MNAIATAFNTLQVSGLSVPLLLITMLAMVMLPIPPWLLDLLFTFNLALSLVVLLASVYAKKPLDFAVFPSVLLVATLLRLALNIASTRVVLLYGHEGGAAAGHVIEAFGEFVIGGNYVVGLVVFAILMIINFVVVTKGAGRVSEVAARFTLDALPGKQMAIDADLNAGLIDQNAARSRRAEVMQEADFYGAMDGASKFVRGDAIAGLIVLFINLIGGLVVGMVQHNLPLSAALETYILLTIGDGLVAQLPALLLSTAAAMLVTRNSSETSLGDQVQAQLFANPQTLALTGAIIGSLGLIPGMPNLPFLLLGSGAGYFAYRRYQQDQTRKPGELIQETAVAQAQTPVEVSWDDVPHPDAVGLEVGYRLIPLAERQGQLLNRLRGVRKKLSQDLGFLLPAVHIRDNLDLPPNGYRIMLHGIVLADDEVYADRELAINPGSVFGQVAGIATRDPAFQMEAVWIEPYLREQAIGLGYTVVDTSTVLATHLNQLLLRHCAELLSHDEVQVLLDRLGKPFPKLVAELTPTVLPLRTVVKVLQNLLAEQVPIKNLKTIAETLVEHGVKVQDADALTALVRVALGRVIVAQVNAIQEELPVITLDAGLERLLQKSTGDGARLPVEPGLAEKLHQLLFNTAQQQEAQGLPSILLVSDNLRAMLARFIRYSIPQMRVLAFSEIPEDKRLRVVATVGGAG